MTITTPSQGRFTTTPVRPSGYIFARMAQRQEPALLESDDSFRHSSAQGLDKQAIRVAYHARLWVQEPRFRMVAAQKLARNFEKATFGRWGTDEKRLKFVVKEVTLLGLEPEFEQAVRQRLQHRGLPGRSVDTLIQREFKNNPVSRAFKTAMGKETLDLYRHGTVTYRGTPWEYRRYGMYRSMADFIDVCKTYPIMSTAVIGATFYLGAKYPFLGGISGVAILAFSGIGALVEELKTRHHTRMDKAKTEHYINSGENLAAFGLTALGGQGIIKGTRLGLKAGQQSYQEAWSGGQLQSLPDHMTALGRSAWRATIEQQPKEAGSQNKMHWSEAVLFVSGLLDNVLLPFNWAADQLQGNQKPS